MGVENWGQWKFGHGALVGGLTGALVGGLTGALVGGLTGAFVGRRVGALVGGLTGALVGGLVGKSTHLPYSFLYPGTHRQSPKLLMHFKSGMGSELTGHL
jgi:Glycine zipper